MLAALTDIETDGHRGVPPSRRHRRPRHLGRPRRPPSPNQHPKRRLPELHTERRASKTSLLVAWGSRPLGWPRGDRSHTCSSAVPKRVAPPSGFKALENDVVILAALTDIETDWHRGVPPSRRHRRPRHLGRPRRPPSPNQHPKRRLPELHTDAEGATGSALPLHSECRSRRSGLEELDLAGIAPDINASRAGLGEVALVDQILDRRASPRIISPVITVERSYEHQRPQSSQSSPFH